MSRVRIRPTREDTRERLFEAAARVFEEQGIGAASIGTIATAAGLTRGAVYSNFANKEDLIVAMLEDHTKRSLAYHRQMLARHRDPSEFVGALRTSQRSPQDPIGRAPLLHMELILYVARAKKRRPELAAHLRAGRELISEMVAGAFGGGRVDPVWAGAMLLALQDGYRLHRLIDPTTTPTDSFIDSVAQLQRLVEGGESGRRRSGSKESALDKDSPSHRRKMGPRHRASA
jgi:AcrR family transcriptional regulator